MFCRECGKEIENEVRFCPYCGADQQEDDLDTNVAEAAPKAVEKTDLPQKKTNKKPILIGIIVIIAIAAGILIFKGRAGEEELSGYLPLAKDGVMKFIQAHKWEDEEIEGVYSSDELMVMLDDNGNIEHITITAPSYSLYGIQVGDKFDLSKQGKALTEQNYGYLTDYPTGLNASESEIVYGIMSGRDTAGGDRIICIKVDGNDIIQEIKYGNTGAQDMIEELESLKEWQNELSEESSEESLDETEEIQSVSEQESEPVQFILQDTDKRVLTEEEVAALTPEEARLAKNEIYAKYGRKFNSEDLQQYFDEQSWYHGIYAPDEFNENVLNGFEKENVKLLGKRQEEADNSSYAQENQLYGSYKLHTDLVDVWAEIGFYSDSGEDYIRLYGIGYDGSDLGEFVGQIVSSKGNHYTAVDEYDNVVDFNYKAGSIEVSATIEAFDGVYVKTADLSSNAG